MIHPRLIAAIVRRRRKLLFGAVPSGTLSTLVAAPWGFDANGVATSTVTVTTRDASGNPMAGVLWTAAVVESAVSAGQSQVQVSTSVIANNGIDSCVCTLVARDASGNPLPGIPASQCVLAVTGTGNTVTQPTGFTDANGAISGSFVSTVAEGKTVSFTAVGLAITQTQTVTVSGTAAAIDPGVGDTIWYDDDFTDTATWAARRTKYNDLVALGNPAAIFDAPADPADAEITPTMVTPGYSGSTYAIELDVPAGFLYGDEVKVNFPIRLIGGLTPMASTDTLFVDIWMKVEWEFTNFLWIKGLMAGHPGGGSGASGDRTQYGFYRSSATLGYANINPQSQAEIHMHQEDGAPDAPVLYKRWSNITGAGYLRHTMVFKKSTTTGTTRDGIARHYVAGEKIIDASLSGRDSDWMVDRVNGVDAASTNPYPGNVGEKYSNTTGDACLLLLADEVVNALVFPGIIGVYGQGTGAGKITIGRIRCWKRPA